MPLADVLRIEQLPLSRIEYVGTRPVINFEGQLLPVEDSGGILLGAAGNPEAQIVVVVCREGQIAMWASRFRMCSMSPRAPTL